MKLQRGDIRMPALPRSGQCNCGGKLEEREHPRPGVRRVTLCASCGKWYRWSLNMAQDGEGGAA